VVILPGGLAKPQDAPPKDLAADQSDLDESMFQPVVLGSQWTLHAAFRDVMEMLRERIPRWALDLYLDRLVPVRFFADEFVLIQAVPDLKRRLWIESRLMMYFRRHFHRGTDTEMQVQIEVVYHQSNPSDGDKDPSTA
jgi:hypothetical protein